VGGLPQAELNQLELQVLLLNDFNLVILVDEMQRYASQLIAYSRESKNGTFSTSPIFDKPPVSPLTMAFSQPTTASSVGSVLNSVAAVQLQQNNTDLDASYDTEDETICPSHSSGASETSSVYTVRNDDEEDGRD
jgi:PHO85 cyclin-6/7